MIICSNRGVIAFINHKAACFCEVGLKNSSQSDHFQARRVGKIKTAKTADESRRKTDERVSYPRENPKRKVRGGKKESLISLVEWISSTRVKLSIKINDK